MATTLTASNQEFKPKAWEEVPCPLCGGKNSRLLEQFGYQHRYSYRRCSDCQVAFQSPRPTYDQGFVETAYEVYSTSNDFYWKNGQLTEQGKIVATEFKHILEEIKEIVGRKGKLLEIGCNTGFFLKIAKDENWEPIGVEISNTMAEVARRQFEVQALAGDWVQQKYPHSFDAIYCSHVIEHIPDPRSWMKQFRAVLNPGGVVCLSVPNMNSIDRIFKRFLKRIGVRKDRWQPWQTPDHLYEPCEKSMRRFFKNEGFQLIRTYTYPSQWLGRVSLWHRVFHFWLRWGAKQRYYITPTQR